MNAPVVTPWWGEFEIPIDATGVWRLGPLCFQVRNEGREWLLSHRVEGEPVDSGVSVTIPSDAPLAGETRRYCFSAEPQRLRLTPRLADRPVISRPHTELFVPAGEQVQLFVGTPVWLAASVGAPSRELLELPVNRPSDTWFGPTTREGGLSYAATTRAVSDPKRIVFSPFRAVTPVLVRNRASRVLAIERLNIPVVYLSLFLGEGDTLWTEAVTFERSEGQEEDAVLRIESGPPQEAGEGPRLSEPRQSSERNLVFHAFNALFG